MKARRGYFVTPVNAAGARSRATRCASPSSSTRRTSRSARLGRADRASSARCHEATAEAISHDEWDAANAAFHENQVDLAGNALLSRFYRELSVNLMMQVIRGGRVERHAHLVTEHDAIVEASRRATGRRRGRRSPATSSPGGASRSTRSSARAGRCRARLASPLEPPPLDCGPPSGG